MLIFIEFIKQVGESDKMQGFSQRVHATSLINIVIQEHKY